MNNFYGFKPFPYDKKPVDLFLFRRFLHPLNFSSNYDVCNLTTKDFYENNQFWFFLPDKLSPQIFLWYLMCADENSLLYKNEYEEVIYNIKNKIVFLKGPSIYIKDKNIPFLERAMNYVDNIKFIYEKELNFDKKEIFELPHKFGFWMFDELNTEKKDYITKNQFLNPSHPFEEDPSFNVHMEQYFDSKYSSFFHDKDSVIDPLGDLAMEFFWDILSNFNDIADKLTYNSNLALLNPEFFNFSIKGVISLTGNILTLQDKQRSILARALIKYKLKYTSLKDQIDKFFYDKSLSLNS
jgi:hypothetical protein